MNVSALRGFPQRPLAADVYHIAVLHAFALSQPAFDCLKGRGAFLTDAGATAAGITLLVLIILLAPPLLLCLILWGANRLGRGVRDGVFAALLVALLSLFCLPVLGRLQMIPSAAVVMGAVSSAIGGAWLYFRYAGVRSMVSLAGVGLLVFPGLFLYQTAVGRTFMLPATMPSEIQAPAPIVFVVFDEFCGLSLTTPEGKINGERFPRFAELASRSTWYRRATTVHAETACVLPVMLTGNYPTPEAQPSHWTSHQPNLFNFLTGSGEYALVAFEPVSRMANHGDVAVDGGKPGPFQQVGRILPEVIKAVQLQIAPLDLRTHLPRNAAAWWGMADPNPASRSLRRGVIRWGWSCDRIGQFRHFIDCLEPADRPALHFLHVVFPHVPWMYLPSGRPYSEECGDFTLLNLETVGGLPDLWSDDSDFVSRQQQRYLLQVELADRLVGELIDRLEAQGLWNDCLLIVTGDHGVSFRPGQNRRYLSEDNADEILSVPLFIKLPGQTSGQVDDRRAESIDILPTIAAAVRGTLNAPVDGRSLLSERDNDPERVTFVDTSGVRQIPIQVVAESRIPFEILETFGRKSEDLFHIGPCAALLGRPAAEFARDQLSDDGVLELNHPGPDLEIPAQGVLPCYFEGIYRPAQPEAALPPIAIAVNGTIRAVARPLASGTSRGRWDSLVPESALHAGHNEVAYFRVIESEDGPVLVRCPTRQAEPRLLTFP